MNDFKDKFTRNFELASKKFKTAIEEIDKTIDHLQKTKDALLSSENNLRLANNKAEDLSIKRLTKIITSIKNMQMIYVIITNRISKKFLNIKQICVMI
jgi:hypothetical protein